MVGKFLAVLAADSQDSAGRQGSNKQFQTLGIWGRVLEHGPGPISVLPGHAASDFITP